MTVQEICASIGADSLGYISLEGLTAATTVPPDLLCRACFDGVYPIEPPAGRHQDKFLLENSDVVIGVGGLGALNHP